MARPKMPLILSPQQRGELARLLKSPSTPQKLVRRAKIVELAAAGKDNHRIADLLQTSSVTVGLWRQRFLDLGMAGLEEAPRPGRPGKQDPEKIRRALTEVVQPPKNRKRWSCRSMARHLKLSK